MKRTITSKLLTIVGASGLVLSVGTTSAYAQGSLTGTVTNDLNGNGIIDASEPGLNGWMVQVIASDGSIQTEFTGPTGAYEFTELPLGSYVVRQAALPGWTQTAPDFRTGIQGQPTSSPDWDYDADESDGRVGPPNWDQVAPDAAGHFQSPIDISGVTTTDLSEVISFHYSGAGPHAIKNNTHNGEIEYEEDNGNYIEIGGEEYGLLQFHFHHDSEHAVDGALEAMELHLVHRHENGGLAVVGVRVHEGQANSDLADFFDGLEEVEGLDEMEAEFEHDVNLLNLLPSSLEGWFYNGSLTTPAATEGVNWFVLEDQIEVSTEQLELFKDFLASLDPDALDDFNNRPVLPLNGRVFNEINHQVNLTDTNPDITGLDFAMTIPEPASLSLIIVGFEIVEITSRRRRA